MTPQPGTLYVVATPIGNLDDISQRALRVLAQVALIACEDTRQTRKLLDRFDLRTPTQSYHEHNEAHRTPPLVARLLDGDDLAIVSDAGTPAVADPGYRLVAAAIEAGVAVRPIPGACAAVAALCASGLPVHRWRFLGFLPREPARRREQLAALTHDPDTALLYASPHRIVALLDDAAAALGPTRRVCVARELTKQHEEWLRGTLPEVADALRARDRVRGECVVLIEGAPPTPPSNDLPERATPLASTLAAAGCSTRTIRDALVAAFDLPRRDAYQLALDAAQQDPP